MLLSDGRPAQPARPLPQTHHRLLRSQPETLENRSYLQLGDWDRPDDVWKVLEERTRPEEEYLIWFNKRNYGRFFNVTEFHDQTTELP